MSKKEFVNEREGQIEFFENYRIPYKDNPVLIDNTDGVYHGNIFEFKLNINDTGKVLFQAIKYLSKMRIKSESVPARILLVDLNKTIVYVYNSIDYIDDIQKVYVGASSTNNEAFSGIIEPVAKYDYSDMIGSAEVQNLIINKVENETDWYIPIDIDENCIVGWAERYYRENPTAKKGDFLGDMDGTQVKILGEIREPKHFKGLINPYTKPTNEKFKYLMDCLNDRLSKKDLGAFYTPMPYCEKASELVMKAVERVPEGNDYIILDRCAGTGNLESALIGKYDKNGSELISHCVVSTYEYYEYKVLAERIGDKVKNIIPPTEANVVYENGKVSNADAMSKEFIDNPLIKHYIDNPKCTIILFENPPYHDESSGVTNGEVNRSGKKKSYILNEMKKEVSGVATNELANQFIWSAISFYLRKPTDSYIVFSPIKYWKQYYFINLENIESFAFNRKHFHATESTIICALWSNKPSKDESIIAKAYDIDKNDNLNPIKDLLIKRVHKPASKFYSIIKFADDTPTGYWSDKSGYPCNDKKTRTKGYISDNCVGYLEADSFQIAPLKRNITRFSLYDGNGCYLLKTNYLKIIPIWVAKHIPLDNWYDKDIYATTSDGGDAYTQDKDFLKYCLIYTCLSNQNKCLSFTGSDGRYYRNELCFDNTHENTVASADLLKMIFDEDEEDLITTWEKILEEAKTTANYNPELTYGVYQITKELNTFKEVGSGRTKTKAYDYPNLNGNLNSLRIKLKEYYKSHITDKMFEYELLK